MKDHEQLFFEHQISAFQRAIKLIEDVDTEYTSFIDNRNAEDMVQVGEVIENQLNDVTLDFIEGMEHYDELNANNSIRFIDEISTISDLLEELKDFQHLTKKIGRNALDPEGKQTELIDAHSQFIDYYGILVDGERTFIQIADKYDE